MKMKVFKLYLFYGGIIMRKNVKIRGEEKETVEVTIIDTIIDEIDKTICIYDPMKEIRKEVDKILKKYEVNKNDVNLSFVKAEWPGNRRLQIRFFPHEGFNPLNESFEDLTLFIDRYIEY